MLCGLGIYCQPVESQSFVNDNLLDLEKPKGAGRFKFRELSEWRAKNLGEAGVWGEAKGRVVECWTP